MEFLNKKSRIWGGKWIWGEEESKINSYYYFRKEIEVQEDKALTALITADTRYKLYVNGVYVGYGPIQSQPYCTYYDTWDLSNYLQEGNNAIGIIAYYGGHLEQTKGGLLMDIVNASNEVVLATNASWKTNQACAWRQDTHTIDWINRYAPSQEFYDARKEPNNWNKVGFDDSQWQEAVVRKGAYSDIPPAVEPWSVIRKREIPHMAHTAVNIEDTCCVGESLFLVNRFRDNDLSISLSQAEKPVHYTTIEGLNNLVANQGMATVKSQMNGKYGGIYNPTFIVDFGKVITAFFEIELEGLGGECVEIGYAERLVDGQFNNVLECPFADCYTLKEGKQTFRSFNWRGYRYVKLIFKHCDRGIDIHRINAIVSSYPYKDLGNFKSSDEKLNQVFEICKYTLRLCSNESIVDTPWREQTQWVGDASAVTIGGIYACFGDTLLPAKYIQQSSSNQFQTGFLSNITNVVTNNYSSAMVDYNLWWVMGVWNQFMYTGEETWIHEYYPMVSKLMMSFFNYVDEYGMLNHIPHRILIDWANHDRKGENAFLNALFYGTLDIYRKMAEIKNDAYMINEIDQYMTLLKVNYVERFFNKDVGCFVDSNFEGKQSETVSEAANMLSIYFDLCDTDMAEAIVEKMLVEKTIKPLVEAEPFMAMYTLKTLQKLGKHQLAIDIIIECWHKRMIENGAKSTYEEWSENGSYRNGKFLPIIRTHSHSWSAGPAEYLIKYLAGIEILEPGCKKVLVNPAKLDFDYNISYPTPQGVISINKTGENIEIHSPEGVEIQN